MKSFLNKHGRRFAMFSGVGIFNTFTDFTVFGALLALGAPAVGANIAAFLAANIQSYVVNGHVTFRESGGPAKKSLEGFLKFAAAHAMSLALTTAAIFFFSDIAGALAAKIVASLVGAVWNYATSAIFAFAPSSGAKSGFK